MKKLLFITLSLLIYSCSDEQKKLLNDNYEAFLSPYRDYEQKKLLNDTNLVNDSKEICKLICLNFSEIPRNTSFGPYYFKERPNTHFAFEREKIKAFKLSDKIIRNNTDKILEITNKYISDVKRTKFLNNYIENECDCYQSIKPFFFNGYMFPKKNLSAYQSDNFHQLLFYIQGKENVYFKKVSKQDSLWFINKYDDFLKNYTGIPLENSK